MSPIPARPGVRPAGRAVVAALALAAGPASAHPPDIDGAWSPVETWPASATHAHLLPSGRVLFWSEYMAAEPEYEWDPVSGAIGPVVEEG